MTALLIENPTNAEVTCPHLLQFLETWQSIKAAEGLPRRRHFTFRLLKDYLPDIAIMDVDKKTGRFLVSLVGTRYTEMLGREMTGMYVDEMPHTEEMLKRCQRLVEMGQPYFATRNPLNWAGKDYKSYSTLGVPLYGDDETVSKILFCVSFETMPHSVSHAL
ncbi:MAG: PAS domain-containing protein [Kordiimonadaceae bacterium]|nr:PAS domain-containing protein [Kordiimonadaceae bacterium]